MSSTWPAVVRTSMKGIEKPKSPPVGFPPPPPGAPLSGVPEPNTPAPDADSGRGDIAAESVDLERILRQGLVVLLVERRAQRRVGGEVSDHQRHDGDRSDGQEESESE